MRLVPRLVLILLALVPLVTLLHRDDRGRWDVQRSAMAAPDEFSYLLMAQHFMHGGGLSLQDQLGRDTYFPPGYPFLLALWGKCFGLTGFTAHAFNTFLFCLDTLVVHAFSRRLLLQLSRVNGTRMSLTPRAADLLALLITGIFATNWHVLESSLLIMSEPAFMLATFAWLALALRWRDWHSHPVQAMVLALLAVAAWSIRGAGIVCVITTILYPLWIWAKQGFGRTAFLLHWAPLALAIFLPLAYQTTLAIRAPEKSVLSGQQSANSYTKQLLHGLIDTAPIDPKDSHPWLTKTTAIAQNLYRQIFGHLDDFAASFVPWLRENPDLHFRDIIGKIFAFLALLGFLGHLLHRLSLRSPDTAPSNIPQNHKPRATATEGGFLELYILLYTGLYLIWPFNMPRFWSPILPVMLVYAADAIMRFGVRGGRLKSLPRPAIPGLLLTLLLALSAEEVTLQLGNYARRLNYVSDALRDATRTIIRQSSDPQQTLIAGMGDDELFIFSWYSSQTLGGTAYRIHAPDPHPIAHPDQRERAHEMLARLFDDATLGGPSGSNKQLFYLSYFPNADTRAALDKVQTLRSGTTTQPAAGVRKIYQKEIIVTVWEITKKSASLSLPAPRPSE